jgi:carboxymethylenebutenolidase
MRIDLPSGTPAELVRPPGEPTLGVVVAPDIFGLRPLYVDLCTRLANENGWVVCAPEPFPGRQLGDVDERFEEVRNLEDDRVIGDLVAAGTATECSDVALIGF